MTKIELAHAAPPQPNTFFTTLKNSCIKTALVATAVYFGVNASFITTTATLASVISDRVIEEITDDANMPHAFTRIFQTAIGIGSSRFVLMSYHDLSYQENAALFAATIVASGCYALQRGFMGVCNKYFHLQNK
jgi:hypothetical protein